MPKAYCPPRWAEMVEQLQLGVARRKFLDNTPTLDDCRHRLLTPILFQTARGRTSVRWQEREPVE